MDKLDPAHRRRNRVPRSDARLPGPIPRHLDAAAHLSAEPGSHALYFGNQRIFRTTDRGRHWQAVSPDLTRENPATPATLDPATARRRRARRARGAAWSTRIGPSPLDARLVWAGTDDGLVWRTRDGGAHWQNVTPAPLTAWSKIGIVEPSHFDADSAYIAVDRHRLDDPRPYIYRTHDGGSELDVDRRGLGDGTARSTPSTWCARIPRIAAFCIAAPSSGVYRLLRRRRALAAAAAEPAAHVGARSAGARARSGHRDPRTRLLDHG